MDSLKVLDPEGPIREADIHRGDHYLSFVPSPELNACRPMDKNVALDRASTPKREYGGRPSNEFQWLRNSSRRFP
jgi:hypothetical protein